MTKRSSTAPCERWRTAVAKRVFGSLNAVVRPAVQAGLGNPFPVGAGAVVLEATGRSSGLPRLVPLAATRFGDSLTVSTVRADSQWLRNVEANGQVNVWLGGARRAATADVTRGPLNTVHLSLEPSGS